MVNPKNISSKIKIRQEYLLLPLLLKIVLDILARTMISVHRSCNLICSPKDSTKKLEINKFSKVTEYKVNINICCISIYYDNLKIKLRKQFHL